MHLMRIPIFNRGWLITDRGQTCCPVNQQLCAKIDTPSPIVGIQRTITAAERSNIAQGNPCPPLFNHDRKPLPSGMQPVLPQSNIQKTIDQEHTLEPFSLLSNKNSVILFSLIRPNSNYGRPWLNNKCCQSHVQPMD